MLAMSWSTFRERWQLFVGAVITVSVGVALVQASLLTLISAVAPTIPDGLPAVEEQALDDRLAAAVSLLGTIVGISVFVAFFVVGSTFSFTVAQRSRDFALLRLVGASRRQVRRLLLGEALLLGSLGTVAGALLGLPVARFMTSTLVRMEFVPAGFSAEWHPWILFVSAATGIGVAAIGSLSSSRRASRVRPLEALRETGRADRVMTLSRWFVGAIALAGATALMVTTAATEGDPMATTLPGLIVAIIALSALSPLAVPLIGRLLGWVSQAVFPRSQIRELVHANLRDGVRRSSSTAAPIVMLVGLLVGFSGTINVVSAGTQQEAALLLDGDLVVTTTEPFGEQLEELNGAKTVSEEVALRVRVESERTISRFEVNAMAISPNTYQETHRLDEVAGDLDGLHGETIALDRNFASSLHVGVGDTVELRLDGEERAVRVVATVPYTLSGSPVLLPIAFAPDRGVERRYIVQTDTPGSATAASLSEQITRLSPNNASVSTLDDWVQNDLDNQQKVTHNYLIAVLGLVTLYVVIAMINAVVIAAADRRSEFATARLTGLTRGQVIHMALWESLVAAAAGIVLGLVAAGTTTASATAAVSNIVGTSVVAIPWALLGAATVGAVIVVGSVSVMTTLAETRQRPVDVAGARE